MTDETDSKRARQVVKKAIREAIGAASEGVEPEELPHRIRSRIERDVLDELGGLDRVVDQVREELEQSGEIERRAAAGKQRYWLKKILDQKK